MASLKILSFNCYLLPENPLHRICPGVPGKQDPKQNLQRIQDICDNILASEYDIVCLQEVWMEKYRDQLVQKLGKCFPHHTWNRSGFFGSGLMTFSRFPFLSTFFRPFLLNDKVFPMGSIDSTCGKGLTVSTIDKNGTRIAIINTHPQSELIRDTKDSVRLHQLWEIASMARYVNTVCDLMVLCGDLNATPDFLGIKLLKEVSHVEDTFCLSKKASSLLSTYACLDNKLVECDYQQKFPSGIRIDYIFVSSAPQSHSPRHTSPSRVRQQLTECEVRIRPWELWGEHSKLPLSDHEPVEAEIKYKEIKDMVNNATDNHLTSFQNGYSEKVATSAKNFFKMTQADAERKKVRALRLLAVSYFSMIILSVLRLIDFFFESFASHDSSLGLLIVDTTIIISLASFCLNYISYYYHGCSSSAFQSAVDGLDQISDSSTA